MLNANSVKFTSDTLNDVYVYGSESNGDVFQGLEFHTGTAITNRYRLQQDSNGYITLYRRKADGSGWDSVYKGNLPNAVTGITRSGTTFTATRANGTTFTFTQQDNNTWNANGVDTAGYVAAPSSSKPRYFWATDNNGIPAWRNSINVVGASASANGTAGLAPAPTSANYANRTFMYLRSDGGWQYLPLANNATTTAEHYALDARMGKTLKAAIDSIPFIAVANASSASKSCAAGVSTQFVISALKSGYQIEGVIGVWKSGNGNGLCAIANYYISQAQNSITVDILNTSSSAITVTVTVRVIYSKT